MSTVVAFVVALGLQGCGRASDESEIQASVHAYVTGLAKHDAARACAVITPAYWSATAEQLNVDRGRGSVTPTPANSCERGLTRLLSSAPAHPMVPKVRLTDIRVHGDTATGSLVLGAGGSTAVVPNARFLRGGNGVWRIDCCAGTQVDHLAIANYQVPSASMEPTIKPGQIVTTDNAAMRAHPPALGDIVVFHPPAGADAPSAACGVPGEGSPGNPRPCGVPTAAESVQTFIKRVVGLPGDRIAIVGGHVIRNGVRENDPYILPCSAGGFGECDFPKPIIVPAGEYYVLGDNRSESDDSRFWGPVKRDWIIGVVKR